jgi:hypothetical protein
MDLTWDGPDPKDKDACPYTVEFYSKPFPAETLNSLESGRILLEVGLGTGVTSVTCQLINKAKLENLDKVHERGSNTKRQTSLSTIFAQDSQYPSKWVAKLSIPSSWLEGTTSTHEKTGAATPQSDGRSIYILEITYTLDNSNRCTARFSSDDVFHWQARSR